jgi:hypothetical protein
VSVISALGRVTLPDAESEIATGALDMVGAARPLIAEPELLRHAREGREKDSRTCIGTNLCAALAADGAWGCAINPATGRERRWGVDQWSPSTHRGRVVVVGGGPAGLESARVAAMRGHDVVLFEARGHLGGQLRLWAGLPGRELIAEATEWYAREVGRLGVNVRLGSRATRDAVLAESPDSVVIATGAHYSRRGESGFRHTPIPGVQSSIVSVPEDILEHRLRPRGSVVVLDDEGLNTGLGVAELLAADVADVVYVCRSTQPGEALVGSHELPILMPKLCEMGIRFMPHAYVDEIAGNVVSVKDLWSGSLTELDSVSALVLVTMRDADDDLARSLEGAINQLFCVGDALAPRGLTEATYEGHRFARAIGEDGPSDFLDAYWNLVAADD